MKYIYSLGILIYNILIGIASLFNDKASGMIKGRKETFGKIREHISKSDRVIWFHCASLGEFEQARPVIEKLKSEQPSIKILITFYSPSGYNIRYNYDKADCIVYLPADSPSNAYRLIRMARPEKAVFVKYEFWYNYLSALQRNNIPVYLISGIFRPSQPFFRWYGGYFRRILGGFTHLYVQDTGSGELLKKFGLENYSVSGDTRFDRVMAISSSSSEIEAIRSFREGSILIVAGSSWQQEEEMLAGYINNAESNIKLIIAPHIIDAPNISRIEDMFGVPCMKYSEIDNIIPASVRVLIIDSIGMLSSVYRYADLAVIGGGFGKGIHNILEAATWAVPVIFGPRYKKFREATDLIKLGGAKAFYDYAGFVNIISSLVSDPDKIKESGIICLEYVKSNQGATDIIAKELLT